MFYPARRCRPFCILLAALVLLPAALAAQETTGSISGKVLDPSGAIIPGATIEVTGSNLPRPILWNSDTTGNYLIPNVPIGTYTMTVTAPGFSKLLQNDVNVIIGRATRVDFTLQVGQPAESITVTAEASTIDSSASASAVNIDRSFFDQLPKGRSFADLTELAPGARNEAKSGGFQVDGASGAENIYYVDGMEVTNIRTGVLSQQNGIPVEAIQQVQVKNGVMEAQYGGAMGGVVNAVVRSGTNSFHGQAGFYFTNDSMSARPRPSLRISPYDDSVGEYFDNPMDGYTRWNPIFNLGGPILKDRLFFFSSYMPVWWTTSRTVNFVTGETGDYSTKMTQQYLTNKLDFMPWSKLTMSGSWMWNPNKNEGVLPSAQGIGAYSTNWADRGDYTAGNIISGQVNYIPTSTLLFSFRGGYHYTDYSNDYGLQHNTTVAYANSNLKLPGVPDELRRPAGFLSQGARRTDYDIYRRINLNADVSYLLNWRGQHNLKAGWQMNQLANKVWDSYYPDGWYGYAWNLSYRCVTSQCSGARRGKWGYYMYRFYTVMGDVSGDNMGLFVQDSWTVNKHLTLNLGLRTEHENVPSYAPRELRLPDIAIEFNWGQKLAPRLGFAYDPRGDGKMKIYGSWGYFYDLMKYEMARGEFGGLNNRAYAYTFDDPYLVNQLRGIPADPTKLPGYLETVNYFVPANDPSTQYIDPNLKPMKQSTFDLGFDYSLRSNTVLSLRYTDRRLLNTIEDVGTMGPAGESYRIANPGYGVVADPATWDPGIPVTPKVKRNYDALEVRLDRRFSRKYQFSASYIHSRIYGNYSGLASSDENGRVSPNVERYFDQPWIGYTEKGVFSEGRLATDRPNTFKFYGTYTQKSRLGDTTFSPAVFWYSGTPLTTEVFLMTTVAPAYAYGRGDLGRTPQVFRSDVNLLHEFKPFRNREEMRFRVELSVFNLFNSATVVNRNVAFLHPNDGYIQFQNMADIFKGFNTKELMTAQKIRSNPIYNKASEFMAPRYLRVQVAFMF